MPDFTPGPKELEIMPAVIDRPEHCTGGQTDRAMALARANAAFSDPRVCYGVVHAVLESARARQVGDAKRAMRNVVRVVRTAKERFGRAGDEGFALISRDGLRFRTVPAGSDVPAGYRAVALYRVCRAPAGTRRWIVTAPPNVDRRSLVLRFVAYLAEQERDAGPEPGHTPDEETPMTTDTFDTLLGPAPDAPAPAVEERTSEQFAAALCEVADTALAFCTRLREVGDAAGEFHRHELGRMQDTLDAQVVALVQARTAFGRALRLGKADLWAGVFDRPEAEEED